MAGRERHLVEPDHGMSGRVIPGRLLIRDEWFLLKDGADIAAAFLKREPSPTSVQWRSMNEMFAQ